MTEEIIIDECYFCDNGICNIYPWTCDYDGNCKDNNECKVKEILLELKRLEQENRELKEKITSLESEIRQKKMTIMMNNDHYLTVDENNRKYRSALEEIREIADKCKECLNEDDDCGCDYLRIKRRIEEVLGNENN